MVSASLLVMLFSAVQFQAQQLLPPPAPGESVSVALGANAPRDTELLQNGGFETAAHWTGVNLLTTTKRVCNRIGHPAKPDRIVAHEGSCAFQLGAEITNVKRQLKQVAASAGAPNDTLQMSFWAAGTDLTKKPRAQVTVVYTDNTKKKFNVTASAGTYGYTQFSGTFSLKKTPKQIVVNFIVMGSGIKPGRYSGAASPADLAPTLAQMVGVRMPRAEGRVLREALTIGTK